MAVAVQIERAAAHPVPAAQGVMAEHERACRPRRARRSAWTLAQPGCSVVAGPSLLPRIRCLCRRARRGARPPAPRAGGPRSRRDARPRPRAPRPRSSARASASSISAVEANGRRNRPRAPPWPKWWSAGEEAGPSRARRWPAGGATCSKLGSAPSIGTGLLPVGSMLWFSSANTHSMPPLGAMEIEARIAAQAREHRDVLRAVELVGDRRGVEARSRSGTSRGPRRSCASSAWMKPS